MKIYNSLYASVWSGVCFVCCGNLMGSHIFSLIRRKPRAWQETSGAMNLGHTHLHKQFRESISILHTQTRTPFSCLTGKSSFQGLNMSPPAIPALGMPSSTIYASTFGLILFLWHKTHSHPVHTTDLQPTPTLCCFRAAYGISLSLLNLVTSLVAV